MFAKSVCCASVHFSKRVPMKASATALAMVARVASRDGAVKIYRRHAEIAAA